MVDITAKGAIVLGPDIVCDGFLDNAKYRVQSHIHSDHMRDFETSKGFQDILMSPETYDLLLLEKNLDLCIRPNLKKLEYTTFGVSDIKFILECTTNKAYNVLQNLIKKNLTKRIKRDKYILNVFSQQKKSSPNPRLFQKFKDFGCRFWMRPIIKCQIDTTTHSKSI